MSGSVRKIFIRRAAVIGLTLCLLLCACGNQAASSESESLPQTAAEDAEVESPAVSTQEEESPVLPSQTEALRQHQAGDPQAAAIFSENYSFTQGEILYLYCVFYDQYYYYTYFGDVDFLEMVGEYAERCLYYCEAGRAAGIPFDAEDEAFMDQYRRDLEEQAAEYNWDVDTFLSQCFLTEVTYAEVEAAIRKIHYSEKAYDALVYGAPTQQDVEEEFESNLIGYACFDYIYFNLLDGEDIPSSLIQEEKARLNEAASLDDFKACIRLFLQETEPSLTEEDTEKRLEEFLEAHTVKAAVWHDDDISSWAFGGAKAGDICLMEDKELNRLFAYYLIEAPHKGENWEDEIRTVLAKQAEEDFLEDAAERYPVQKDESVLESIALYPEETEAAP